MGVLAEVVVAAGFNGGVASYVRAERVCSLLDTLRSRFRVADDAEVVLRALLGYVNEFKLRDYRAAGVTGVDVDWHTCGRDRSRMTGRAVWPEQERVTVRAFAHYGMEDVGYQVLYGLPGQTLGEWRRELSDLVALNPSHVEARAFEPAGTRSEVELGNLTKVYGERPQWHRAAGAELDEMREAACEALGEAGYAEYLAGCFARPGRERRYLLERAGGTDCLALGAGGLSCIDGVCSENVAGVEEYVRARGRVDRVTARVFPAGGR